MANFYGATSLIGGGTGALDAINGASLADLDAAFVITLTQIYIYSLDADSAAAESSPNIISPDSNAGNKRWILTSILFPAGASTGNYNPSGVIHVDTTAVGTDANTNEKDLMTFSLPANTLNADGKGIKITAKIDTAANANVKTLKLYFDGASFWDNSGDSVNDQLFNVECHIFRTSAGNQKGFALSANGNGNIQSTTFTDAADETAAITIKITGENGTAAANDIKAESLLIEFLN